MYEGEFVNGKYHGQGNVYNGSGELIQYGYFKDGILINGYEKKYCFWVRKKVKTSIINGVKAT